MCCNKEHSPRKENHKQTHTKDEMFRNYCQKQVRQFSGTERKNDDKISGTYIKNV